MLKLTGKIPPAEYESFEQVGEWVNTNGKLIQRRNNRSVPNDGIAINVEFSETEYGRANYSVQCSGSADFRVGAEDLLEMIQSAPLQSQIHGQLSV